MNDRRLTTRWRREGGQALLLAIIVMLLLALLAAGMVAVVSSGLESGGRDETKVRARWLAEAGIRYADDLLSHSPLGADWRPALPAWQDPRQPGTFDQPSYDLTWDSFEILRGWDPQNVSVAAGAGNPVYFVKYRFAMDSEAIGTSTEAPDDDPGQDFVPAFPTRNIENVEETAPHDHFLLRVEYAPNPAEPLSKHLKITAVGRPGGTVTAFHELVAYKPLAIQDYLLFVTDRERGQATASLGQPAVDIDGDGSTGSTGRNEYGTATNWEASGANDFVPLELRGPVRSNLNLSVLAPIRFETIEPTPAAPPAGWQPWREKVEVAGSLTQVVDAAARPGGTPSGNAEVLVQHVDPATSATSSVVYANDNTTATDRTQPTTPSGAAWPSQLEVGVARRVEAPPLETYEPGTGVARWERLTRYSGDDITPSATYGTLNSGELGYGRGIYVDNGGQLDQFETAPNTWFRPETWGGRQYVPNGVLIELYAHYPDELDLTQPPAIAITRTDNRSWVDPTTGNTTGSRTMVFDWPDKNPTGTWNYWNGPNSRPRPHNGIILCDGNVRVRGRLPLLPAGNPGDFNLTIVSRGSIYIDGPLLRPSDYAAGIGQEAPENTRLALLARDHVVINPTMLALGPVPAMPPAPFTRPVDQPDDAHWVLDANGTQAMGIRAAVCRRPNDGSGLPSVQGGRRVTIIDADGNVNDGVQARLAVLLAKTRQTIGLEPETTGNTNVATNPWLVNYQAPGRPGSYSLDGTAPNLLRSAGVPTFFADWRNYNRALYPAGAGGGQAMEYFPDSRYLDDTNWNLLPANEELGVPSYVYLQSGVDLKAAGGAEARSDLLIKNAKIERCVNGDDGLRPRPGLEFVVSAVLYAERGSLYVIPGDWFDPRVKSPADLIDTSTTTMTTTDLAAAKFARLRRFNYRITINGAIAVNHLPSLMEVGQWTDKWCYPSDVVRDASDALVDSQLEGAGLFNDYDAVKYCYDWGLRTTATRANLPRLPGLPASPGLIYVGEENKR